MTETPEQTDERRARALRPELRNLATCMADPCQLGACLCADELARAIRASDEAARMVLVPMKMTEDMQVAWVSAYANSASQTAYNTRQEAYRAMIVASQEKPE